MSLDRDINIKRLFLKTFYVSLTKGVKILSSFYKKNILFDARFLNMAQTLIFKLHYKFR